MKTIEDLSLVELVEDLDYYMRQAIMKAPPMLDEMFNILFKYVRGLEAKTKSINKMLSSLKEDLKDVRVYEI